MKASKNALATGLALLAVGTLVLTGCTYESEKLDRPVAESAAPFDANSVRADTALASQVPQAIRSRGKMVVGSNTEYPPAEFLDSTNKPTGYDIALITAVAKKLGLDVDVQSAEFTGILPALGPKYDAGISSFTITKERLAAVNMVSVVNVGTTWAVQKGNPKKISLDNVCGLTVGVQTGTTQEDPDLTTRNAKCKADGKPGLNVVSLKNQTDITTRLINGSIDTMTADSPITGYAISQTNGQIEPLGNTYDTAPQGIAVAKSDLAWAELIQKALTALKDDGSYDKIMAAWGSENSALKEFKVNPEAAS